MVLYCADVVRIYGIHQVYLEWQVGIEPAEAAGKAAGFTDFIPGMVASFEEVDFARGIHKPTRSPGAGVGLLSLHPQ